MYVTKRICNPCKKPHSSPFHDAESKRITNHNNCKAAHLLKINYC